MSWFRVDDHLHAHSKAVRAGTEAMGLWILAGSWSAAEESDGWVPGYMLVRLAGVTADAMAERLTAAGLWERDTVDGVEGFRFHQWDEHQPTREQLEARRAESRERMRRARAVRANTQRSSEPVRTTRPDPTRPTNNTPDAAASEPDGFAEFWSAYPRHTAKANAVKAYAKAVKAATPDAIMHGLANANAVWTVSGTEARFIPHAASWLNAGRWEDEHPTLMADAPTVRVTHRQCGRGDGEAHDRHPWTEGDQPHMCLGWSH